MLFLAVSFISTHPITKIPVWLLESRIPSWEETANYITKKPYLGYGYQSYTETVKGKIDFVGYYNLGANPCSDYGQSIFEFGIPIIVFIGLFFLSLLRKFRESKKERITYFLTASVVIGLSNMLWQNMIRYSAIGGTFIVILALLTRSMED
uniref:O-antigen ligase n=1 Tax=viral metagenome TaxID=1070528 RepID=A0A6M3K917_9ZZZZ